MNCKFKKKCNMLSVQIDKHDSFFYTEWSLLEQQNYLLCKVNTLEVTACIESLPTIQQVTHCPKNYAELQLAVQRKRCDVLANTQTCVPDPNEFVYHCLEKQLADGFVEVCAPKWRLAGKLLVIFIEPLTMVLLVYLQASA